MRARLIIEKFTEESDPITDMGVGLKNNPKILLPMVIKELKKYGINVRWEKSYEFGAGHFDLVVEGNSDNDKMDVQYFYSTDAAAHEEGWKGGFSLADDGGTDLCKVSHDPYVSIKTLLKRKYGTIKQIAAKIEKIKNNIIIAEKNIEMLKEIEKML